MVLLFPSRVRLVIFVGVERILIVNIMQRK